MENIKNKYPEIPVGRATDMTGERYGRLTALYRTEHPSKNAYWVLKCDCGEYVVVRATSIRYGNTKSCGCFSRDTASLTHRIDLTGQTFNMLTAIKASEERSHNQEVIWHCSCECGNKTTATGNELTSGRKQSCGCGIQYDLTGKVFGRLTAIERIKNHNFRNARWLCSCECGSESEVFGSNLTNGHTKSCGCITGSIGEENIAEILRENGVKFIREQTFDDLINPKTNAPLKCDFAIFKDGKLSHIIEFDGVQHFKETGFFGKLEDVQYRDEIKNQYCKDNNIPLIRIPYWKRDEITLEMLMI